MNIFKKIVNYLRSTSKRTLGKEEIGETFVYRYTKFKVVGDKAENVGCYSCAFRDRPCCLKFNCFASERSDRISVHYIKVEK